MSHWYSASDGSPMYEVPKAKGGGTRSTTLADARKLKLYPSVTTILAIAAKPQLEIWKQNQILKAVIANPYDDFTTTEDWKKLIFQESQREGREAAQRGDEVHNALEHFYKYGQLPDNAYDRRAQEVYDHHGQLILIIEHPSLADLCFPAIDLLSEIFGMDAQWIAEQSFSHKEGFGGKCDLHMQPCDKFPSGVILDFKTKSAEDFSKVKPYDEHCTQLAAYREGFNLPEAECYNLFISTKTPGQLLLHKWSEKDAQKGWQMFRCLLQYWVLSNNFEV